jgi:hypothetical protein
MARLDSILAAGLVTQQEYDDSTALVRAAGAHPSVAKYRQLRSSIRFEVVRWTAAELLQGWKTARGGTKLALWQACGQPALCKLDAVAWLPSRQAFTDFSVIYAMSHAGRPLNDFEAMKEHVLQEVREEVDAYLHKSPLKACKRMLTVAKLTGNRADFDKLSELLAGPASRLYQLRGDVETMTALLAGPDDVPLDKIRAECDGVKARLSTVAGLASVVRFEPRALSLFEHIAAQPSTRTGAAAILKDLHELSELFKPAIDAATRAWLRSVRWWPVPRRFLP